MPGRIRRIRECLFLASLLAVFPPMAAAPREWRPLAVPPRDLSTLGIAVSDKRVLAASPGWLYELDEAKAAWSRLAPGVFPALAASSSRHYTGTVLSVLEDSGGSLRELDPYPIGACCALQAAAEDSARYYLRFSRDNVLVKNKQAGSWGSLYPLPQAIEGRGFFTLIPFPDRILAGHESGVFASSDRGRTWDSAQGLPRDLMYALKRIGDVVYASLGNNGVYRSRDHGRTWSRLFPAGSPYAALAFRDVAGNGDTLWLVADFEGTQGVYRSRDDARSWEWVHDGLPASAPIQPGSGAGQTYRTVEVARAAGALWVHAAKWIPQGNSAFSEENGMYQSLDGGSHWIPAGTGLPTKGQYWLKATDGGIKVLVQQVVDQVALGLQAYSFQADRSLWAKDPGYPDPFDAWLGSQGDTVYIQRGRDMLRKAPAAAAWEKAPVPWLEDDTLSGRQRFIGSIAFQGQEVFLSATVSDFTPSIQPAFDYSDDFGKTWSRERPFLPHAVFQGRMIEGRGNLLCWPDDSLHGSPRAWREFPAAIRNLWVMGTRLAVQAGPRLYFADAPNGNWREQSLPDTGMVLAMRNGVLTGFTPDTIRTLADPAQGWRARPAFFPLPEVQNLTAGPNAIWVQSGGRIHYRLRGEGAFTTADFGGGPHWADGGTYMIGTNGYQLDTVSILSLPSQRFGTVQRVPPASRSRITAVFGNGDFMAEAMKKGEIQISRDRGRTWTAAGILGDTVMDLTGSPERLFALAGGKAYLSADSGKTWTALSAGTTFTRLTGQAAFLAGLATDGRILFSEDTGRAWSELPPLPSGAEDLPTTLAAWDGQVLAGTRSHGVFAWGEDPVAIAPGQAAGASGLRPTGFRKGWALVPGQGWMYSFSPGLRVDARGRIVQVRESASPPRP